LPDPPELFPAAMQHSIAFYCDPMRFNARDIPR
jgi:hypothetical protein